MLTTFEIIETDKMIQVVWKLGDMIQKETFCLTRGHAEIIRGKWVNEFWGFKLN